MQSRNRLSLHRSSQRPSRAALRWSAAALIAIAPVAHAAAGGDVSGYLTYEGGQPVISAGKCVHTLEWTPGMQLANCEPQAAKPAVASAPVAAPQPVPAPVVEAPKPVPQPVPFKLSIDTLFDYDSVTLKPEGRAALDALADKIASSTYQSVQITGHADPLGTASYNQSLSERRAQVIGAYLAGRGLDASKISIIGVGSTEPAVALGNCKGTHGAALIRCLQPDRYTEVTVIGTVQQASTSTGDTK
jgi:OmpA-OmpF porin, OOP family